MSRLNSFYLPPASWPSGCGETVTLDGCEARHMMVVLRTEENQIVCLFDGEGRDGLSIDEGSKKQALLEAVTLNHHVRPDAGVTLAIGWGKSKRRNYLFEKLVELNGDGVVFWEAHRSQGKIPGEPKETWNDKCLQAAKQCGNLFVPRVSVLNDGISGLKNLTNQYDHCYLAWESETAVKTLSPSDLSSGHSLVVIGPEGGLENDEANELIEHGFSPVTLGDSILRWETAAIYCLSLGWFARQV